MLQVWKVQCTHRIEAEAIIRIRPIRSIRASIRQSGLLVLATVSLARIPDGVTAESRLDRTDSGPGGAVTRRGWAERGGCDEGLWRRCRKGGRAPCEDGRGGVSESMAT